MVYRGNVRKLASTAKVTLNLKLPPPQQLIPISNCCLKIDQCSPKLAIPNKVAILIKQQTSATRAVRRLLLLATLVLPTWAHAYVECSVTPYRYYVGDGILWVIWREGGAGFISQTSQDFKPTLLAVTTALVAGRAPMTVRYADGTSCTAQPASIVGLWLN